MWHQNESALLPPKGGGGNYLDLFLLDGSKVNIKLKNVCKVMFSSYSSCYLKWLTL